MSDSDKEREREREKWLSKVAHEFSPIFYESKCDVNVTDHNFECVAKI